MYPGTTTLTMSMTTIIDNTLINSAVHDMFRRTGGSTLSLTTLWLSLRFHVQALPFRWQRVGCTNILIYPSMWLNSSGRRKVFCDFRANKAGTIGNREISALPVIVFLNSQ